MKIEIRILIIVISFVFHLGQAFAQSGTIEGNTTPCALGTYHYTLVTEQFPISIWWSVSNDSDGFSSSSAAYLINPGGMETDVEIVANESFYLIVNYSLFESGWEVYYSTSIYVQVAPPTGVNLQQVCHTLDHIAVFMDVNPNHHNNPAMSYAWQAPAGWIAANPQDESVITYHSNANSGDVIATVTNACGTSEPDTIASGTPNCQIPQISQSIQESPMWNSSYCGQPVQATISTFIQLPGSLGQYELTDLGDQTINWNLPAGFIALSPLDSISISFASTQNGNLQVSMISNCGNDNLSTYHTTISYPSFYDVYSPNGYNIEHVAYAQGGDVIQFVATDSIFINQYADSIVWQIPAGYNVLSGAGTSEVTIAAGVQSDSIYYTVYFPCDNAFNSGAYQIQIAPDPCNTSELDYFDFEIGDTFHFLCDSAYNQPGVEDTTLTWYEVQHVTNKVVGTGSVAYTIHQRNFQYLNGNWIEGLADDFTRSYGTETPSFSAEFGCGIQVYPTECDRDTATRYMRYWSYTTPQGFVTNYGNEGYTYARGLGNIRYAKESHAPNVPVNVYVNRNLVYWQKVGADACGTAAFPESLNVRESTERWNELSVFPNPTSGMVQLNWPNALEVRAFEVYNAAGQCLERRESPQPSEVYFDSAGVYWIRVFTADATWVSSVLVY